MFFPETCFAYTILEPKFTVWEAVVKHKTQLKLLNFYIETYFDLQTTIFPFIGVNFIVQLWASKMFNQIISQDVRNCSQHVHWDIKTADFHENLTTEIIVINILLYEDAHIF